MSAADAAHELNNLLTVVLGTLEQLGRQALDDRGRAQLDRARLAMEQANHLLQHAAGANGWVAQPLDGRDDYHLDAG